MAISAGEKYLNKGIFLIDIGVNFRAILKEEKMPKLSQKNQKMKNWKMEKKNHKVGSTQLIKDLPIARRVFNFKFLLSKIKRRGDLIKLSRHLNIEKSTLCRAVNEARILSYFPKILKSKANPLSTIKLERELEIFAKHYDIDRLEVRQLYKSVLEWRRKLEKNPRILLTSWQHDLIIGSTFGDASIREREKKCNFRVGHTKEQEEYLLWKYHILKEFTLSVPQWNIRKLNDRIIKTLELATATHYVFNYYRKLFYKKGIKKITREVLNLLNPRSLAIWLCDDGSYDNRQGYIVICTNSYTLKEHKIMKKYFKEVWGLSPTIGFRDKKYYYLRFKQDDSKKLIEIVRPYILEFMKYKIGEKNA